MGEDINEMVAQLRLKQERLGGEIALIRVEQRLSAKELKEKHLQTSLTINEIRGLYQSISEKLNKLEIRQTGWSLVSGGLVAVIVELVRVLVKGH